MNSEVEEFDWKVEEAIPCEVRYARLYWTAHLSCVNDGDEVVVCKMYVYISRKSQKMLYKIEASRIISLLCQSLDSERLY